MPRGRNAQRASARPRGRAAGVDRVVVARVRNVVLVHGIDAGGGEQLALTRMTRDDLQCAAVLVQGAGDELAEAACADEQHARGAWDGHARCDRERRRQRLGEDGGLVGHVVRHRVQVCDRQHHALGEGARVTADAEHATALAVEFVAGATLAA